MSATDTSASGTARLSGALRVARVHGVLSGGWWRVLFRFVLATGFLTLVLSTPELFSIYSLAAILDAASLVGLVAIGMTFITISGNIFSVALGATMATAGIAFMTMTSYGLSVAFLGALLLGVAVNAVQGWLIGAFRANAIVVSIAAFSLLTGIVTQLTGGAGIFPAPGVDLTPLRAHVGPVNVAMIAFPIGIMIAQFILLRTSFGLSLALVGANRAAADAAGIRSGAVVTGAYALAGAFCAVAGILAASRFDTVSLETGAGYDYDAIAIVMLGGISMRGGNGSALRTLFGALILAAFSTILMLKGLGQGEQRVLIGALALAAICLTPGERR